MEIFPVNAIAFWGERLDSLEILILEASEYDFAFRSTPRGNPMGNCDCGSVIDLAMTHSPQNAILGLYKGRGLIWLA
ncbi:MULTISPECIES: hypothetical protein [unclassified Moorena]|uniref:hypothetical protein n=1 Tax=unclassified Moorena TaxID=2683338 RepID=UPI0013C1BA15|nr:MULTISPECIES: hypothetical protein [unclassified Moorena]NEO04724.1 hypothetical protein [Moorena sp. SIO3I8]NEP21124.1 hypothetical protein [Moorena sp. SIO3I6]